LAFFWVFVTFGDGVLTELMELQRFIGTVTEKCPSRLTARNTRTFSHPSPKVTKSQDPLHRCAWKPTLS
jgi:hypothetical protein